MRKKFYSAMMLIMSVVTFTAAAGGGANPSYDFIKKPFKDGDFLPSVFLDHSVVRHYGAGTIINEEGRFVRIYCDKRANRTIGFFVNEDSSEEFRFVEEIAILKGLKVGSPVSADEIENVSLFGIRVGTDREAALGVARKYPGFRIEPKSDYFGIKVEEIFFENDEKDSLTYYKYLIKEGSVVGLAIGVAE